MVNGILLVDKPVGWTSFDVVNKVRHTVQNSGLSTSNKKRFPVGHTGTLDPLATGLLVLLLGSYTKRAPELTKLDKTYKVTMKLGEISTTGDEEGEKTHTSDKRPSEDEVLAAIEQFKGEIEQTPPAYSAVKVNGQRAYKLARAGKAVKIEPRKTTIYEIKPGHKLDKKSVEGPVRPVARLSFRQDGQGKTGGRTLDRGWYEYPGVKFTAKVSSGTYIRTLVEDIGKTLSTGAYTTALRRTEVGRFSLADSVSIKDLTPDAVSSRTLTL